MEVYVSNVAESWTMVKKFTANKGAATTLVLPGENIAKYLRLCCVNNVRGGNLVNIKYV